MKFTGRLVVLCAAILFQGMALEAQGPSQFQELFFQNNGALIFPPKLEGTPGLEAVRTLDEVVRRIKTGNFR